MPEFRIDKVKKYTKGIHIAVETGTFKGDGTKVMSKNFKQVYTIELDDALHASTSAQLKSEGFHNIEFLLGDSGARIEDLAKSINQPALFYLDAHWSGDDSVDWANSEWKGYKTKTAHLSEHDTPTSAEQVPLDREISSIATYFQPRGVIYVDDLDKFSFDGKGLKNKAFLGEDYSHLDLKTLRGYLGTRLRVWKNLKSRQLIIEFDAIPNNKFDVLKQKFYYHTVYKARFFIDSTYLYLRWLIKGK